MPISSNLRSLNLNFLPILREVLRQRSFSAAAKKLHLTQPAVSNTMRVLREHFDDELLARSGKGMELTTKGKQLLEALEIALSHIETVVGGATVDLGAATGTIRIATVDNIIGMIAGPLSRLCAEEAPNVHIELLVASRNMATELQSGGIDIAITSTIMMDTLKIAESDRRQLRSEILADERLVCIGPRDDASLAGGLTLEDYVARPHASFIVDPEQHHTVERQWLADMGLNPNSRIRTASNLSLPDIVATSGCLSLVPESLARKAVAQYPIQIFDPPMIVPDIRWVMIWHERSEIDAIVKWAMDAVIRSTPALLSPEQAHSIS
jgi:LysR family transcriptional regulator, nod-box dependent transcriptional activator